MGPIKDVKSLDGLDELIEPMLLAAGIPGAGVALIAGESIHMRSYGYRDLQSKQPMTVKTVYPIASTTKAMNATLIGLLVDEGWLNWDLPVQNYLPQFRLRDPIFSAHVTLRDLIAMRTGLPRHDWMWIGNPITRGELVERLRFLELSSGFRERFQYNNLTVTAAGYVIEVVLREGWDELVSTRILKPLGMRSTVFSLPAEGDITLSYHENAQGELALTRRFETAVAAPAGGSMHSTLEDMVRWAAFNLRGLSTAAGLTIKARTLDDIQSPWTVVGAVPESTSPRSAYGGGWFVDTYSGRSRLSHSGYLHDINSDVSLFPEEQIGIVSFTNFGFPRLSRFINENVFDWITGSEPTQRLSDKLALNKKKRDENAERIASALRVEDRSTYRDLNDYSGHYAHPGYGVIAIERQGEELVLRRHQLCLRLEHWNYDVWAAGESTFLPTHERHPFDRANRLRFDADIDGLVAALCIQMEPSVAPIRFEKL